MTPAKELTTQWDTTEIPDIKSCGQKSTWQSAWKLYTIKPSLSIFLVNWISSLNSISHTLSMQRKIPLKKQLEYSDIQMWNAEYGLNSPNKS